MGQMVIELIQICKRLLELLEKACDLLAQHDAVAAEEIRAKAGRINKNLEKQGTAFVDFH